MGLPTTTTTPFYAQTLRQTLSDFRKYEEENNFQFQKFLQKKVFPIYIFHLLASSVARTSYTWTVAPLPSTALCPLCRQGQQDFLWVF